MQSDIKPPKNCCKKYNIFAFSFLITLYNGDHMLNIFACFKYIWLALDLN
jgi:hypothetical protein